MRPGAEANVAMLWPDFVGDGRSMGMPSETLLSACKSGAADLPYWQHPSSQNFDGKSMLEAMRLRRNSNWGVWYTEGVERLGKEKRTDVKFVFAYGAILESVYSAAASKIEI